MANNKIIDLDRLSRFKNKLDIELDKKANVDGNYPTMTAGNADNLTPYGENSGANDSTPFVFQTSGGSSDVGVKAYLRELRGNSVVFNQLKIHGNFDIDSGWSVENATKSVSNNVMTVTATGTNQVSLYTNNIPMINGHKYYLRFTLKNSNTGHLRVSLLDGSTYSEKITIQSNVELNTTKQTKNYIFTSNLTGNGRIFVYTYLQTDLSGGETTQFENYNLIDLTLMFGAGNEPTSVVEFNRLFPKPYYQYNAGTLLSCKVNGIKNVGYNQLNEIEVGLLTGGIPVSSNNGFRTKDFIRVVAGQTYSFENGNNITPVWDALYLYEFDENKNLITNRTLSYTPNSVANKITQFTIGNNTTYIKIAVNGGTFVFTSDNLPKDLSIHLTWDGSRTGYEPYEEWQYALPNIELKSAGSVYDELKPDGTLIRRVGSVGTTGASCLILNPGEAYERVLIYYEDIDETRTFTSSLLFDWLTCNKYTVETRDAVYSHTKDKTIAIQPYYSHLGFIIYDSALIGKTAEQVLTALNGLEINYYVETPTEEQTTNTFQEIQDIDDFGTQEFLYDSDITIPVPQGNDFFYPVDYKAFVDSLGGREDIEYAADQVVSQEQLQNALSTFLSSISGYDATKTQTLKNVSGVFQWVDD